MAIFTQEELEGLTKNKLMKIATYLKLDVSEKAKKQEIIDAILYVPPVEEAEPQMSVRIRRIKGV
jgi:hypothetical protein